jgi:hypothetical protein
MLLVSFLLFLCSLCFALYTVAQDIQAEKTKETTAPLPKTETAATAPSEPAKNTVVEPVKAQDVPPGPAASDEKDQAAASGIMSLIEDDKDAAPQPIIINGDNIE